jgi:hypothetical protein
MTYFMMKKNIPSPRRIYSKPTLLKIGKVTNLTKKTGSQFDMLTSTNSFAP